MQPATVSDLETEAADAWARIVDGTGAFDRITREAAAVRSCTLKEARKVFTTFLAPSSEMRRCLAVEVHVGGAVGEAPQSPAQACRHAPAGAPGFNKGASRGHRGRNMPQAVDCGSKQHVGRHKRGAAGHVPGIGDGQRGAVMWLSGPLFNGVDAHECLRAEPVCWQDDGGETGEGWQEWRERLDLFAERSCL